MKPMKVGDYEIRADIHTEYVDFDLYKNDRFVCADSWLVFERGWVKPFLWRRSIPDALQRAVATAQKMTVARQRRDEQLAYAAEIAEAMADLYT